MKWQHDKKHGGLPSGRYIAICLIVLMLGAVGFWAYQQRVSSTTAPNPQGLQQPQASSEGAEGRYLLNGTVTWSRGVEQVAGADSAQPFSQLNTFERSKYDGWTASLECPITHNEVSFSSQVANLVFNCPPRFLPEANKFFSIYDLANNHTYDQGQEIGLTETRQYLSDSGAQFFGTYDSADTSNICEVVSLPVHAAADDAAIPVAFCGWQYFSRAPVESELAVMDRYAKIMPVFAFVEAGVEYRDTADDRQVSVGHLLVDHGADFVIINSPHWVQNTEAYNGKLIAYSMGNFIFDQLEHETNRSVSIDVTMKLAASADLSRWIELGKDCSAYHDTCLETAEQNHLTKLAPRYVFGIVAGQNGYKVVTHKSDAQTQTDLERRTNWSHTCQQLGYNQCQ
jgi:poly-gamma-glutamate synthesis protein (capsule biosynthesis protein)